MAGSDFKYDAGQVIWLIGSLGLDLRSKNVKDVGKRRMSKYHMKRNRWKEVFAGGLFVEPHMPELEDFKQYFLETVKVRLVQCDPQCWLFL